MIETALVIFLLLILLFGITEFSRAWYTKNSIKNAVRTGARLAVVTPAGSFPSDVIDAEKFFSCPNGNTIINAVCSSPGVTDADTTVYLKVDDDSNDNNDAISRGDTVIVRATTNFSFVVGGSPWLWDKHMTFPADASMRYE